MHERRVSFEYAKDDNRSDLRWCLPQALKDGSAGPLVVAWDEDRDDVRTFRLDRIEGDVTFA
jgi:predicted DNA-binding transcriptional regulator YafY